jgi:hypothetical protein
VVWGQGDSTGGAWRPAQRSFSSAARHLWILEATPRDAEVYRGYVAVDNLSIEVAGVGGEVSKACVTGGSLR